MMPELTEMLSETTAFIRANSLMKPRIGLVLGSGLGPFADGIEKDWSCEYHKIPHFGSTSVEGHKGKLILGKVAGIPIAALQGRLHGYEGFTMQQVVFPTRTLAMLGIQVLIVTNAAGGLSKKMRPGDFMAIKDHINLMSDNPLRGKNIDKLGPRFPDMSEAYDKKLVDVIVKCAKSNACRITRGVYVGVQGPTYETPAEIRYLRLIGGHAVGMSTVPEVIAANHFGLRVGGISCITNLAAGIKKSKLNHQEVTAAARQVEQTFKTFMTDVVIKIAEHLDAKN